MLAIEIYRWPISDCNGYSQLIKALLPFSTNEFWFFTCYLLILLFSPYLNGFVDRSSQRQFKKLLTALCLFSFCYQAFFISTLWVAAKMF